MVKHNTEIVVLLEAYESYTSAAVQCQYSYKVNDIGFCEVHSNFVCLLIACTVFDIRHQILGSILFARVFYPSFALSYLLEVRLTPSKIIKTSQHCYVMVYAWSNSKEFVPCLLRDSNGVCTVDLDVFHKTRLQTSVWKAEHSLAKANIAHGCPSRKKKSPSFV